MCQFWSRINADNIPSFIPRIAPATNELLVEMQSLLNNWVRLWNESKIVFS